MVGDVSHRRCTAVRLVVAPLVLRVYDREAGPTMSLVHSLRGHRHQNWPIRSAFMRSFDSMRHALLKESVLHVN